MMRDENEDTQRRLKAAEILLACGMPKGDPSKYLTEDMVTSIAINIVHHERPELPAIEAKPQPELPTITFKTVTMGES
jgi:hypothetical protein